MTFLAVLHIIQEARADEAAEAPPPGAVGVSTASTFRAASLSDVQSAGAKHRRVMRFPPHPTIIYDCP